MALYGFALALMAVMRLAPDSELGRLLNRQLVVAPMRAFGRMERHHLIFVLLILSLAMVGGEVIFALGTVDFAVIWALDVSLYVDGLVMSLALASLARTRSSLALVRTAIALRIRRVFGRRRKRSAAAGRLRGRPANDDDHPAVALAA